MQIDKHNLIFLPASIVIAAVILAIGFSTIVKSERSVSVRGLAEKEVLADLAVWQMSFSVGDNDLVELQKKVLEKTKIAENFLNKRGLNASDYTIQAPSIIDNSINPYMDSQKIRYTYIAKATLLIRTNKISEIKQAQRESLELASDNIAISQDYENRIAFEFTKLNDIKPQMIAEATKNAKLAAEQFATLSGSEVGKIKKATQGLFSIENAAVGLEEKKNIRVVTQVEYLLK
ncbi:MULTISPECIES: SIMPL domain-containing protein [Campylobacter]|uniref:SIMPL domain-containing protein n=1 Tax=Campylobacter TaxID=194 RepID=UPI00138E2193|nr:MULTISPECIES: SIMPL domain-containing protein [Campylobacter]MDV2489792.1 SIMPL domain-containing protein [Campylobacter sp. TJR-1]